MLFRIKIITLILLAAVLTGGIVWLQKSKAPQPRRLQTTDKLRLDNPVQFSGMELERYSSSLHDRFSTDDLAENLLAKNIQKCAADILQAVLPEKSILLAPMEVELLAEQTALAVCRAVIFHPVGQKEQIIKCRVRVNYLPSGSCEAEYPEFFSAE